MESFRLSDYQIIGKQPSKIVEGYEHNVVTGLRCPRCKHVNAPLDHGQQGECPGCGLHMLAMGNSLRVWVE